MKNTKKIAVVLIIIILLFLYFFYLVLESKKQPSINGSISNPETMTVTE